MWGVDADRTIYKENLQSEVFRGADRKRIDTTKNNIWNRPDLIDKVSE